jgi:hypothetical protein
MDRESLRKHANGNYRTGEEMKTRSNKENGTWAFNCPHAKNGTLYFNHVIIVCPKCKTLHRAARLVMPSTEMVMEWTKNLPTKGLIELIKRF